ncbi:ABI gene family member 3 isoform X2 [Pseudophryne corroboree]|uniref:ABI gene family member 3 isoform X2 n=1 Tax=Pseudophryne corroboree TaxID=495146 RepID=UPI0030816DE6
MTDSNIEISTTRQALRDSYQNLYNVADYCEKNYMEAPDKHKALENTMSLVTQTLASVACQVGTAAQHLSDMLEKQSQRLQQEEARVLLISQLLDIHVEKVSRQKIGRMTTAKRFQHTEKILYQDTKGPLNSYTRVPINFTSLDDTGHGIKDTDTQLSKTGTMSRKITMKSMSQTNSSLRRSFRVKEPVVPPLIPEQKFPNSLIFQGSSPNLSDMPEINGDHMLPPPPALFEFGDPLAQETPLLLERASQFSICKSLQNTDDFPPPPPVPENTIMNKLQHTENGNFQVTRHNDASALFVGPTSLDDLPPPPDC